MSHLRDNHSLESIGSYEKVCKQMMRTRKVYESSSISRNTTVVRSGARKSRIERKRESNERRAEILNDPLNKTPFRAVNPGPGDKRDWWDGCLYQCNLCLQEFPDPNDMNKHVDKLHRQEKRYSMMKHIYSAVKITYFNCKICMRVVRQNRMRYGNYTKLYPGMRLKCQKSSIMDHLHKNHSLKSIGEYERTCKRMKK